MTRAILFAGGGTGGHIYPNAAIVEALLAIRSDARPSFLVSHRSGDVAILERLGYPGTQSPVRPLPPIARPWRLVPFLLAWRRAVASARALLEDQKIAAVVATGGFVSGPAIVAAARLGLPRALVNLDAVPGKANRRLVTSASKVFSVFASDHLPGAEVIGFPLRAASKGAGTPKQARAALDLGLDPDLPVLFVTGATHGAESIIQMMIAWCESAEWRPALDGWQVLHQCGAAAPEALKRAYAAAGVRATVVAYLDKIGLAFRAADVVIARAGAGTVAEAWANGSPTVFLPNPYHHDHHQRRNAQPMADAGGALVLDDKIEAAANLATNIESIAALLRDDAKRREMRDRLDATRPPDGAATVAAWVASAAG